MPGFSVRADPFNLLLEGLLDIELEVAPLKFVSFELVPRFVVNQSPPTFGYVTGRDEQLERASNGAGPLAGGSMDVGLWLEGKALKGTVLRAILTDYSYEYRASDGAGTFDKVKIVERQFLGYLGAHSRWGAFTIAGGFGLGAVLNPTKRCFDDLGRPTMDCNKNQALIYLDRRGLTVTDLNGGLGSFRLLARFSAGVAF